MDETAEVQLMTRTISKLSLWLVFFFALAASVSAQSGVQYIYDQLGRPRRRDRHFGQCSCVLI